MAKAKKNGMATLVLSQKIKRHIEVFNEYSKLTGIPLVDVLDECLSEYIAKQCPKR
jgi:hypothetical protein